MKKRFKKGDLAKLVITIAGNFHLINQICEIIKDENVVKKDGTPRDYIIRYVNGEKKFAYDFQLQPLNPPPEPSSLTRSKEVSCENDSYKFEEH